MAKNRLTQKYKYRELEENKFHILRSDSQNTAIHGHEFLEFTYVINGSMEHNIDGEYSIVNEGDYFIVDYGTMHEYKVIGDKELVVMNLLFYPEFIERTLAGYRSFEEVLNSYLLRFSYKTLNSSPTGKTFHDSDGQILSIVNKIQNEYLKKKSGYIEFIRCMFVEMLILTMRKIGNTEQKIGKSDVIIDITEYIKKNYSQKLRLSDIAKMYNYSLSHISKKFTRETGMGFSEYLQKIRIEHSCKLLESTDLKISEVANLVGYDNIKFFNRIFKDILKLTPREFKKLHR